MKIKHCWHLCSIDSFVFKNRTEQNKTGNYKKISQISIPLRFKLFMTVSERLRPFLGPTRLAHHRDIQSLHWRRLQEWHRPPFEWITNSLLYLFRCVECREGRISHIKRVLRRCHPKQSLRSCEFDCRSFIEETPWAVCFLSVMWKTLCVLMGHIRPDFTERFTFRFCIGV